MARYQRFTFLCNRDERKIIAEIADKLQRSQSDAVRFVVLNAAKCLADIPQVQEQIKLHQEAHVETRPA